MNSAGVRNCLALSEQLVSCFELADDLYSSEKPSATGVWRVRFMVESPAQYGRIRTPIHRGTIPRGYVTLSSLCPD